MPGPFRISNNFPTSADVFSPRQDGVDPINAEALNSLASSLTSIQDLIVTGGGVGGGGGGLPTLFTDLQNADLLQWDETAGKWVNTTPLTVGALAYASFKQSLAGSESDWSQNASATSISADGNTLVLGAYGESTSPNYNQGAVWVFIKDINGSWIEQAKLFSPTPQGYSGFGYSVSLSATGNRLVVGDYVKNTGSSLSGAIHIYERVGTTWTHLQQIVPSNPQYYEYFGWSSAVSGDGSTIIVGSPYKDVQSGQDGGAAFIYTLNGGSFTEQAVLVGSTITNSDLFGYSVAINADGTRAAVGAPYKDPSGYWDSGTVYAYSRSGSTWTETQIITPTSPSYYERVGWSMCMSASGDTIAVGAPYHSSPGYNSNGAVYVFQHNGSTYLEEQKLTATTKQYDAQLGYSVSISPDGTIIAAGSRNYDNTPYDNDGSTYLFTKTTGVWSQKDKINSQDAANYTYFGTAVSLSSATLVVTSPTVNIISGGQGKAYTYDLAIYGVPKGIIKTNNLGQLDTSFLQYNLNLGGNILSGLLPPSSNSDATNKYYVDSQITNVYNSINSTNNSLSTLQTTVNQHTTRLNNLSLASGLSDVSAGAASAKDVLRYNGNAWKPDTPLVQRIVGQGTGTLWSYKHLWTMDEASGSLLDSASSNHLLVQGSITYGVPGATTTGTAISSDGNWSNYLYSTSRFNKYDNFSISVWIKTTATYGLIWGLFWGQDGGGGHTPELYLQNGGLYVYNWQRGDLYSQGVNVSDNNWHHIVFSVGSAGTKLYIDGVVNVSNASLNVSESNFYLLAARMSGSIDKLAIFDNQLSDVEVASIYNTQDVEYVPGGNNRLIQTNDEGYVDTSFTLPFETIATNYTASSGQRLLVDTTSGVVTVTLPASPESGQSVEIVDAKGTFSTNNLTINGNGQPITGDSIIATANAVLKLVYVDATTGWTNYDLTAAGQGSSSFEPFAFTVDGADFIISPATNSSQPLSIFGFESLKGETTVSATPSTISGALSGKFFGGIIYFQPSTDEIIIKYTPTCYTTAALALAAMPTIPSGCYPIVTYTAEIATINTVQATKFFGLISSWSQKTYLELSSTGSIAVQESFTYTPWEPWLDESQAGTAWIDSLNKLLIMPSPWDYAYLLDPTATPKVADSTTQSFFGGNQSVGLVYASPQDCLVVFYDDEWGSLPSYSIFDVVSSTSFPSLTNGQLTDIDAIGRIVGSAYDPIRHIVYLLLTSEPNPGNFLIQAIDMNLGALPTPTPTLVGTSYNTGITNNDYGGYPDLMYDSDNDRLWIKTQSTQMKAVSVTGLGQYNRGATEQSLDFILTTSNAIFSSARVTTITITSITNISTTDARPLLNYSARVELPDAIISGTYTHTDSSKIFNNLTIEGNLVLNAPLVCKGNVYVSGTITGTHSWTIDGSLNVVGAINLTVAAISQTPTVVLESFTVGGTLRTDNNVTITNDCPATGVDQPRPMFRVGEDWFHGYGYPINIGGKDGPSAIDPATGIRSGSGSPGYNIVIAGSFWAQNTSIYLNGGAGNHYSNTTFAVRYGGNSSSLTVQGDLIAPGTSLWLTGGALEGYFNGVSGSQAGKSGGLTSPAVQVYGDAYVYEIRALGGRVRYYNSDYLATAGDGGEIRIWGNFSWYGSTETRGGWAESLTNYSLRIGYYGSGGNIFVHRDAFAAQGSTGATLITGDGDSVVSYTQENLAIGPGGAGSIYVAGNLTASTIIQYGVRGTRGGSAGGLFIDGNCTVTFLTRRGGDATGTDAFHYGGDGGITNVKGTLTALRRYGTTGGDILIQGGNTLNSNGGDIRLEVGKIVASGAVTIRGGNSTNSRGGWVYNYENGRPPIREGATVAGRFWLAGGSGNASQGSGGIFASDIFGNWRPFYMGNNTQIYELYIDSGNSNAPISAPASLGFGQGTHNIQRWDVRSAYTDLNVTIYNGLSLDLSVGARALFSIGTFINNGGTAATSTNNRMIRPADLSNTIIVGSCTGSGQTTFTTIGSATVAAKPTYRIVVDAAGGGDYTSIRSAISALSGAAGSIFIRNGTYTETDVIDIYDGISITGESKSGVIITSSSGNAVFQVLNRSTVSRWSRLTSSTATWDSAAGDGTISVTKGSTTATTSTTTITGSESGFILIDGTVYEVASTTAPSTITLSTQYAGTTTSGLPYQLRSGSYKQAISLQNFTITVPATNRNAIHCESSCGLTVRDINIQTQNTNSNGAALYLVNSWNCLFENIQIIDTGSDTTFQGHGAWLYSNTSCVLKQIQTHRTSRGASLGAQLTAYPNYRCDFHFSEIMNPNNSGVTAFQYALWKCKVTIDKGLNDGQNGFWGTNPGGCSFCDIYVGEVTQPGGGTVLNLGQTDCRGNRLRVGLIPGIVSIVSNDTSNGAYRQIISEGIVGTLLATDSLVGNVLYSSISGTPIKNNGYDY